MEIPWEELLLLSEMWEEQQSSHINFREDRFSIMFDLAEEFYPGRKQLLDIACGTGSISRRFLSRFRTSHSTAVDYDPVLLTIARAMGKNFGDRLRFIEGDLRKDAWIKSLQNIKFDVSMSTTALHWLTAEDLRALYSNIYEVLQNDGIFMNGDHMISNTRNQRIIERVSEANRARSERNFLKTGAPDWDKWWSMVRSMNAFNSLMEERSRRYSNPDNHNQMVTLEKHIEFLESAGFKDVDVVWQYGNDRILVARK